MDNETVNQQTEQRAKVTWATLDRTLALDLATLNFEAFTRDPAAPVYTAFYLDLPTDEGQEDKPE